MPMDIRLNKSFPTHPKTRKLKRILGADGVLSLISLWCFAGEYKTEGILDGLNEQDIADASGWPGNPKELISALIESGYLDYDDEYDIYNLHDWEEHQPWVFHTKDRVESAKKAARERWKKNNGKRPTKRKLKHKKDDAGRMRSACGKQCGLDAESNAPSPIPIPIPSPSPIPIPSPSPIPIPSPNPFPKKEKYKKDEIPYKEIIDHLNQVSGKLFRSDTESTRKLIRARWREGWRFDDFKAVHENKSRDEFFIKNSHFLCPDTLYRPSKFEKYRQDVNKTTLSTAGIKTAQNLQTVAEEIKAGKL